MANVQPAAPSAPSAAALPAHETNGFMYAMLAMLSDIDAQQGAVNLGVEKEKVLKGNFDAQKAIVKDEEEKLKELIEKNKTMDPNDVKKIQEALRAEQAQMSHVQAEQTKLSFVQNGMAQEMKRRIDPAQQMIQNDSVMFGGMLHSFISTERTR
ncbi:MAG: hypothetical protein ACHQT8_07795 [Chlamydiales bacterium]